MPVLPMMAVVTLSKRPNFWTHAAQNILRQTRKPGLAILGVHRCSGKVSDFLDPLAEARIWALAVELGYASTAGAATNELRDFAARRCDGWTCAMDDDDLYLADYLEGVEKAAALHPQAILIGHSSYRTFWVGQPRDEFYDGQINPDGTARSLAGPTICIKGSDWRNLWLRYPDIGLGCDGQFVNGVLSRFGPQSVVHAAGGFFYCRYPHSEHEHEWKI